MVVVFLTHGEIKVINNDEACDTILNHDMMSHLHTFDEMISVRSICDYFTDEYCPSLANKPRIFFIQACQDKKENFDGNTNNSIALQRSSFAQKDFLIAYSSMPGEKSFRTTGFGSWYIQALCKQFNERGNIDDLLNILTRVSLTVACDYESYELNIEQKKQMPCIVSRLTKMVFFPEKKLNDQNINTSVKFYQNTCCCFTS